MRENANQNNSEQGHILLNATYQINVKRERKSVQIMLYLCLIYALFGLT